METVSNYISVIQVVVSSCFLLLLAVVAWRVLNWAWLTPKKLEKCLKKQGLNGRPYKLLFGDFKEIKSSFAEAYSNPINLCDDIVPRILPHLFEVVKNYGKSSYIWFGPNPAVLITDPEHIKEVAEKIYVFQKPHEFPLTDLLAQGLFSFEGNKWSKQRKLLSPAFHMEKLKLMLPAFEKCASEMLSKWEDIVSPEGSAELDVWPDLETLASDAISRTAFGSNYEKGKRIFELQREQAEHLIQAARSFYVPGLRFLPTKRHRRMIQIVKEVNDLVKGIIDTRLNAMRAGESCGDDLLGVLLRSNSQEIEKHGNKDFGMNIAELIEECKLFYLAGQETTSALLAWTMILLSKYPVWQSQAREEVFQQFGTNSPDFDGLNHLKIVTMILHEVLRLYPPLPNLERKVVEETKLGNFTLPAGVQLHIPTMFLHHDPEIWGDDVKEFKPERFAEGVWNAVKGKVAFFPFGWGPRICIGQNFAMLEAKMALSMVLQRFSFELSPSYSHAPRAIITVQPQHGAHLILHKL